ncbi:MAG: hypothetical protein ABIP13_10325 [Tepidiformaceae bacterium]
MEPDETPAERVRAQRTLETRLRGLRARIGDLRPDDLLLLDELTDQLGATRRLLGGDSETVAEAALARFGGQEDVEARIAAELAVREVLEEPDLFEEAHRRAVHALEVLEREGYRQPRVPSLGPLKPVAAWGAEFVAEYLVKSYAEGIVGTLRKLYARREAQCPPGAPERRMLAHARIEIERIAPSFTGGGPGGPFLILGGILVPAVASISQYLGAISFTNRTVLTVGIGILFALFFLLSGMLLAGASVARRRSRLIMRQPLAGLWASIGHAGTPPEDDATFIATVAIAMTAVLWFVLPAAFAVVYFLF